MWRQTVSLIFLGITSLLPRTAVAAFPDEMHELAQDWASARYDLAGDERKATLAALIKTADELAQKYPDRADGYVWAGILRCSLAEVESKLTALELIKGCRTQLEKALSIDPNSEEGYAYGILGTLYARAPGWPLAFGDKKKADELLQKSLAIAPEGMNANYFYAKFLYEQKDFARARTYIERARVAQPPYSPETSRAVVIRQREIRELDEKLKSENP